MIAIDTRAEIRELLATTALSERAIARATQSDKRSVARIRVSESIERPTPHKPMKRGQFDEIGPEEIARRAEELRATWSKKRLRADERVERVDYSGSWDMVSDTLKGK